MRDQLDNHLKECPYKNFSLNQNWAEIYGEYVNTVKLLINRETTNENELKIMDTLVSI